VQSPHSVATVTSRTQNETGGGTNRKSVRLSVRLLSYFGGRKTLRDFKNSTRGWNVSTRHNTSSFVMSTDVVVCPSRLAASSSRHHAVKPTSSRNRIDPMSLSFRRLVRRRHLLRRSRDRIRIQQIVTFIYARRFEITDACSERRPAAEDVGLTRPSARHRGAIN
jgi:hypothetical protein